MEVYETKNLIRPEGRGVELWNVEYPQHIPQLDFLFREREISHHDPYLLDKE